MNEQDRKITREIIARIRAEMIRQDLSQLNFAPEIGLSNKQLSRRMTGTVAWTAVELVHVAQALHVYLDDILPGTLSNSGTWNSREK